MLPFSVQHLARVETLAQELDYESPFSVESRDDVPRMLDELEEYVTDDADISDDVKEELLRRLENLREAIDDV